MNESAIRDMVLAVAKYFDEYGSEGTWREKATAIKRVAEEYVRTITTGGSTMQLDEVLSWFEEERAGEEKSHQRQPKTGTPMHDEHTTGDRELSLRALDVGFCLRCQDMAVHVPPATRVVLYDLDAPCVDGGDPCNHRGAGRLEGDDRAAVITQLEALGFTVAGLEEDDTPEDDREQLASALT